MKNLKWGIIGTGYIASRMAGNLAEHQIPAAAVVARNFTKTKKFAQKFNIKHAYQKPAELFADKNINAIYIGTPNNTHYAFIKQALHAGKHVLCEKPMVVNEKQFMAVTKLAQEKNLILEEAFTPFHMPLTTKIKESIAQGKIGEAKTITANFCDSVEKPDPKSRLFNLNLGGGNLLDMGCYPLCFVLQYLNPKNLRVKDHVQMGETGVDLASQLLLTNSKQNALLSSSFLNTLPKDGIISGTKGYIKVKHFSRADTAELVLNNGQTEKLHAGDSEQAWFYEASDLAKYVAQGHDDGELALSHQIIKIMDQLRNEWKLRYPFE